MLNWREIPFVRLLFPFIIGVGLALSYDQAFFVLPFLLLFLFLILAAFTFFKTDFRYRWLFGAGFYIFVMGLAYQITIQNNELRKDLHFQQYLTGEDFLLVQITDFPQSGKRLRVKGNVAGIQSNAQQWQHCRGNILLYLEPSPVDHDLRYGDQILIRGKINPIPGAKNPAAFDFQSYQHIQHTHYQLYGKQEQWKIVRRDQGSAIWSQAYAWRTYFLQALKKQLPTDAEYGVAAALILGNKSALTPEVQQAYANTGATHVLAVSGLHVGFIYLGLSFFLGFFRPRGKAWKMLEVLLLIIGVWAFAFLTGAPPSVLRAATMFSFIIVGRALRRPTNIYNTLALSAVFLLCYNPYFLAEVGFQLSYLAVLGIISFQPWIYRLWIIDQPLADKIWQLTTVGIAAQLATFPITIFYFHQFPIYFWLSGLIVVPAAMMILSGGLLLFLVEAIIPLVAPIIGFVLYWFIWMVNALIYLIQQLPAALIQGLWIGQQGMILLYLGLLLLTFIFWRGKKFRVLGSIFCLAVFLSATVWQRFQRAQQKELVFYHVYQDQLIDLVDGRAVVSFHSPDLEADRENFAAQNYRWKLGMQKQERIAMDRKKEAGDHWWYREGFLQFYDKKIYLLRQSPTTTGSTPVAIDYLILSENPKIEVATLQDQFPAATWIADASNAPWTVAGWEEQCKILGIEFINMGQLGAQIISLKQ